jgi:putative GTP pyrophosphokinase
MYPDQCIAEFRAIRSRYERLTEKMAALLRELLDQQAIKAEIEYRTKTVESFAEKIIRPGKTYDNPLEQVTDLAGIRLVLHSLTDVEKAAALVNGQFRIDSTRSLNKLDLLDPDRFGYLSQHYIVKVDSVRAALPEWRELGELNVEIQIRTTMQHAWAVIQHAFDYKSSVDVPKKLRRRLFRVSALLELADEELDVFAREVQTTVAGYKDSLLQGDRYIELNVDSLRVYVETSPDVAYWNDFLRTRTRQKVESWGDLSRDVQLARYVGITTIDQLSSLLKGARGWGERFFEQYYARYFREHNTTPDKVTTVVNGTVTQLVIAANLESLTPDVLNKQFGYGTHFILEEAAAARGLKK